MFILSIDRRISQIEYVIYLWNLWSYRNKLKTYLSSRSSKDAVSHFYLIERSLVQTFILPRWHELKIKFDIENHVELKKIIDSRKWKLISVFCVNETIGMLVLFNNLKCDNDMISKQIKEEYYYDEKDDISNMVRERETIEMVQSVSIDETCGEIMLLEY